MEKNIFEPLPHQVVGIHITIDMWNELIDRVNYLLDKDERVMDIPEEISELRGMLEELYMTGYGHGIGSIIHKKDAEAIQRGENIKDDIMRRIEDYVKQVRDET